MILDKQSIRGSSATNTMISSPFIDKLSLTLRLLERFHQTAHEILDEMTQPVPELFHLNPVGHPSDVQMSGIMRKINGYSDLLTNYRYAYQLMFDQTEFCSIQLHPRKRSHRYIRLEWNPAKAERAHHASMALIISVLNHIAPGEGVRMIADASITRIDLSFNLHRVSLDSFWVFGALRKSVSGRYLQQSHEFDKQGKLNAVFIGRSDSDRYLLVYDKRMQAKCSQIAPFPTSVSLSQQGRMIKRILPALTRFELRLRDVGSWGNLLRRDNPFEYYDVISAYGAGRSRHDHTWTFFLDSCMWRGAQAALSLIPNRQERDRYRNQLRLLAPPAWWKPDEWWAQVPHALHSTVGVSL